MAMLAQNVHILDMFDEAKCFALVRQLRWPDGPVCPRCQSVSVTKNGHVATQPARQQYVCHGCGRYFDDLTGTLFADRRRPLPVWMAALYLMGLNISTRQIALELGLAESDAHELCSQLRDAVFVYQEQQVSPLAGIVESDEIYLIAGHKGEEARVAAAERPGRPRGKHRRRGRGTLETETPPVLGLLERDGALRLYMLPDVRQETLAPVLCDVVQPGTMVYTDDSTIYARLEAWGYGHQTVNHGAHEFARDDDGDGVREVHINTLEGCWSLLRSWLRPHRGLSQEKLPSYLAFFACVHNLRVRGMALLSPLLKIVLM